MARHLHHNKQKTHTHTHTRTHTRAHTWNLERQRQREASFVSNQNSLVFVFSASSAPHCAPAAPSRAAQLGGRAGAHNCLLWRKVVPSGPRRSPRGAGWVHGRPEAGAGAASPRSARERRRGPVPGDRAETEGSEKFPFPVWAGASSLVCFGGLVFLLQLSILRQLPPGTLSGP